MAGLMLFTNNAATTLATGITNVATSLTVAAGTGALFPAPGAGEYFFITLANNAGTVEIVKCTARTTDTLTITRAQDGTAAVAWNSGDKVELRLVRADLLNFGQLDSTNTWALAQTFSALNANSPVFTNGTKSLTNTGVSPIGNGGTNNGSLGVVAGGVYYGDGTKLMETAAGTAGQVLQSNGASAPTWVAPAVSGNQMALTASGSIALGKVVLQQSDSTVIQMTGTNPSQGTPSFAGGQAFADTTNGMAELPPISATNTAGTTIVTLIQLAGNPTLQIRAGTISGTTITWGTAVTLSTGAGLEMVQNAINFDPTSGNWVVWYTGASNNTLAARTVTVTGTTITLGTAVNLSVYADSSGHPAIDASYDANTGKHVVFYSAITTRYPTISVLTVSGTTVSYGTALVVESVAGIALNVPYRIVYSTLSLKNFICWGSAGSVLKLAMITVSGTTATTGTVLNTGIVCYTDAGYAYGNLTCQLFVDTVRSRYVVINTCPIFYSGSNNNAVFSSKEYTLSGTTLSYSTDVNYSNVINGSTTRVGTALYDSNNSVLTLGIGDDVYYYKYSNTLSNTYQVIGSSMDLITYFSSIDNFTINQLNPKVIKLTATTYACTVMVYVSKTGPLLGMQNYTTIITPATSNRNLGDIYGVSNGTYTNGQTANIVYENSGYYVSGLSGLTINRPYYFDVSNTLSTSATNSTPDGLTLRSLSATQLQVI